MKYKHLAMLMGVMITATSVKKMCSPINDTFQICGVLIMEAVL